jgi:hypothetical protein
MICLRNILYVRCIMGIVSLPIIVIIIIIIIINYMRGMLCPKIKAKISEKFVMLRIMVHIYTYYS